MTYAGRPVVGDGERVAEVILDLCTNGELDNILLIFPDYFEGLRAFQRLVLPRLAEVVAVNPDQ